MKEILENYLKSKGYVIVSDWKDSLKHGWYVIVKKEYKHNNLYTREYAEDIFNELFREEIKNESNSRKRRKSW